MATRRSITAATDGRGEGRIPVRKTYKLYIGGAFPRTESGRVLPRPGRGRDAPRQRLPRLAQGPARRGPGRAARRSRAGPAKTAMNRGQVLYRVAELMEGRRDQFVAEVAAAEGLRAARRRDGRRPGHRPLGLVRRLGRQDRPGAGQQQPGRRAVLQLHDPRGDRGRRRRRARDVVAARARVAARAAARQRQRRRPADLRDAAAAGRHPDRGPGHVRRARRRRQRPDRPTSAELVPVLAAHRDVDALDTWGVPDAMRRDTELLAADDIKRLLRRPTTVDEARFDWLDDRATERPEWIAAFLEMKTVWHPIGV